MSALFVSRRVMAGGEVWTLPIRAVLRVCSLGYRAIVSLRNRRYDRAAPVARVGVPVISVGNITTGGTGKTPLVIDLARRLSAVGRRVAVISRGYKAQVNQLADELLLVARHVPTCVGIQNPDRLAAARLAVNHHHVDAIILDDAFQHRRLPRDLDIVVIDATCPFGYHHLLPRGMLREPLSSLRRADLFVVSRADQVEATALQSIDDRLRQIAPSTPCIHSVHRPTGLLTMQGSPATDVKIDGLGVLCFSGIGNPASFVRTVSQLGACVVDHLIYPDHHAYDQSDIDRIVATARGHGAEAVLTTEKDAVKLSALQCPDDLPILALGIEIDFVDAGGTILQSLLDATLTGHGGP